MENTLLVALSHQKALRTNMEVIAGNIANASTAGYKGEHLLFTEYVNQTVNQRPVAFVQDFGMVRDYGEGAMSRTGNPLDLAIKGKGWFVIETPLGTRYTRNGQFSMNGDGEIVTSSGNRVLGAGGTPLVIEPGTKKIEIFGDGTVKAGGNVSKLKIVQFDDESVLKNISNTLYRAEGEIDPADAENAQVVQGVIEESNVEPILEITDMIQTMRDYQSTQKIIEEEHNRQRNAIQTLTDEK